MIYEFTIPEQEELDKQLKEFSNIWDANKKIVQARDDINEFILEFSSILSDHYGEPIENKPEPLRYTISGDPVYDPDELMEYENSPEYQEYLYSIDEAWLKALNYRTQWENRGSAEWQEANRKNRHLYIEYEQARKQLIEKMETERFTVLKTATQVRDNAREQLKQFFAHT